MIKKERMDRFTSKASDFEIVKPAPKKSTRKPNKSKSSGKPAKKK